MSDKVDYTDGNYVSLSIEELPYERIDEDDYHLKLLPLEDEVPLLVPLAASVPKSKRRKSVKRSIDKPKKKSKKQKKTRATTKVHVKPRDMVTKSGELLRANLSRR